MVDSAERITVSRTVTEAAAVAAAVGAVDAPVEAEAGPDTEEVAAAVVVEDGAALQEVSRPAAN